jgi:hypothetical protein
MKLYSEEQVKRAIELARECDSDCWGVDFYNGTTDEIVGELTTIELPSDEEIEKNNPYEYLVGSKYYSPQNLKYWEEGAKWAIEHIKKQGNDN